MNQYDIAIIGGGFGGITQGIFLQKCGYKTVILERTGLPGGVATAWRRKGEYIFDGATNWIAGSAPSANLYFLLKDVIDFDKLTMIDPDEFIQIEHKGEIFTLYNDLDKLRQEMLRIAPEDTKHVNTFIETVRTTTTFGIPFETPPEIMTIGQKLRFVKENFPFIRFYAKWKKISIGEFSKGFKNETLRELFTLIFPHHPFFSIYAVFTTIAWMSVKSGGYPVGGSEKLLQVMIDSYTSLGGEFRLRAEVDTIQVEQRTATGVKLTNGEQVSAARVISTADGKLTMEQFLGGKYRHPELQRLIENDAKTYPGLIQISFVANKLFGHLSHKLNIDFETPLKVGTIEKSNDMMIRTCPPESGLSPEGTTTFVIHIRVEDTEYWKILRELNRDLYKQEKERVAEAMRVTLKKRFGDFEELYVDTATPATYERYSKAYKASYQGWAPTPQLIGKNLKKTFKGLKKFFIGGQWVWPAGGIPGVARVSRHIAQIICKEDGREFLKK